ncbi:clostripain-related cysteine peptidase, partial [Lyngbya sp. CCY1209]
MTALAEYENLVIESEDDDWFTFTTSGMGGFDAEVRINFSHDLGDLDMVLYDAGGNQIGSSTSTSEEERISLANQPAGTYYVQVYGWNGASNPNYTLAIDNPQTQSDDPYEDNNIFAEASPLGSVQGEVSYDNLALLDDDWFSFDISGQGVFGNELAIAFDGSVADLDLKIYSDGNTLISSSTGTGDYESISLAGFDPGTYYAQVFGYQGATTSDYELIIDAPYGTGNVGNDDRYESNDSATEANTSANLGLRRGYNNVYNNLVIAPPEVGESEESDWFRFEIDGDGFFDHEVRIEFSHAAGDLDLQLYAAEDPVNPLSGSYSITDDEIVSLDGLGAGVYYARVYGYGGATNPNYTLIIDAPEGTGTGNGRDDRLEENDSLESAWPLGVLQGVNFIENGAVLTALDDDWYQFEMTGTGGANHAVTINFIDDFGDLDLELYDANNSPLNGSYSVTDNETVSLEGLAPGVYYAHVYGYAGAENDYTLTINAPGDDTGVGVGSDDSYESNNSRETASDLRELRGLNTYSNLVIAPPPAGEVEYDWYEFEMLDEAQVGDEIRINFTDDFGDLDLELFDGNGNYIDGSYSVSDEESISLAYLDAGNYYISVYGFDGASNPNYTLTIDAPDAPSEDDDANTITGPDGYESNDSLTAATLVRDNSTISGLNIHEAGNADWFRFDLAEMGNFGDFVQVDGFNHGDGDIDIELYDQTGAFPLRQSAGVGNVETIYLDGLAPDTYYVKVFGYDGATSPGYQLTVDAPLEGSSSPGTGISPDRFEENNTQATAYLFGSRDVGEDDLTLTEGDTDWFQFRPSSNGTVEVSLDFNHAEGDVDLRVYDSESLLGTSEGTTNEEWVTFEGTADSDYWVEVYGYEEVSNPEYSLNITTVGGSSENEDNSNNDPNNTSDTDQWTIMVYIAADNNLEGAGIVDINEMEAVNLPDNVNVVVQIDRIDGSPERWDDTSNGNWTDTRRGLIEHDNDTSLITSDLQSLEELNMGDPATLTEFIQWGAQNYPAENYAVVIWDHGGGLSGVAWDETDGNANLSLSEVTGAITDANLGGNLKVVGFDACLQGLVEQAYEIKDLAEVVVASQDLEPGQGWDYTGWLQDLAIAGGRLDAEQMGEAVVDSYGEFYNNRETQSAIRTGALGALNTAIDEFVEAVLDTGTGPDWTPIIQARSASTAFDKPNERDLGSFMDAIARQTSGAIATAARNVSQTLNNEVLIDQVNLGNVSGLSIYLPPVGSNLNSSIYTADNYQLVRDTRWGEFLQAFTGRDRSEAQSRSRRIEADYAETTDLSGNPTSNLNNNSPNLAFNLGRLAGPDHQFSDLSLDSSSDVDWYRFEMRGMGTEADSVQINSEQDGSLTLELYKGNENGSFDRGESGQLGTIPGNEGNVSFSLEGQPRGTYFVKVSGDENPDYTLEVDAPTVRGASGAVEIEPDALEGSTNNNSQVKAHNLGELGPDTSIAIPGLSIGEGDVDWFAVTPTRIPERYPNGITIEYEEGDGELSLELLDAEGNPLLDANGEPLNAVKSSNPNSSDFQSIGFPDTNNTIYIKVAGVDDATNPNYELNIVRRELDIDGDGRYQTFSDGLMILTHLINPGGNNDFEGYKGDGAQRTFNDELKEYFEDANTMLDVDGNGTRTVFTDGLIILSYQFGDRTGLTDYLGEGATRTTNEELVEYLEYYQPPNDRLRRVTQSDSEADEPIQEELWDDSTSLGWLDDGEEDTGSDESEEEDVAEDTDSDESEEEDIAEDTDSDESEEEDIAEDTDSDESEEEDIAE